MHTASDSGGAGVVGRLDVPHLLQSVIDMPAPRELAEFHRLLLCLHHRDGDALDADETEQPNRLVLTATTVPAVWRSSSLLTCPDHSGRQAHPRRCSTSTSPWTRQQPSNSNGLAPYASERMF
jgi:hypothetical protein